MAHALALGQRGQGRVWPNPPVGCVIVDRDARIVGRGRTQDSGRPHAETVALAQAGAQARGATAYVTLEPCAHQGQTPPCASALIAAGVARVVVAVADPDPRVSGKGMAMLRSAGIATDVGVRATEARAGLSGFLSRIMRGRPVVTLKLAASLDGRIATATGESRWITGPAARTRVHGMRACHDAVLVGGGTARADDPRLDVRGHGAVPQPVRIVWSRRLDLSEDGVLARTAAAQPLWLLHGAEAGGAARARWTARGAVLIEVPVEGRQIAPRQALNALGAAGLTSVLCEGGGALAASLLAAGMVDRLALFTAGAAIGAEGTPALGAMGLDRLAAAPRMRLQSVEAVGADVLSLWTAPD